MLVYVCSALKGVPGINDNVAENIENTRRYCKYVVDKGLIPVAPHLLFPQFLDDNVPSERAQGLKCGIGLLLCCGEMWVFGETLSDGMRFEIQKAQECGIPITYQGDM